MGYKIYTSKQANFDVLEGFISNLLKETIVIENVLESESLQKAENRKFNRVDLKCKDSQGKQIIIEIENQREVDYLQRLFWGTSKAVVEGLEMGKDYNEVVKVISISIMYHTLRVDEKENADFIYYGTTELIGMHTKKPLILRESKAKHKETSVVTSKNVFLEYYMIYVEKFEDKINEDIDEWVYFFKHGAIREDFKSPGILLAAKKLDCLMMSEEERRRYDDYLAYLGYELGILNTAKEEGREEGRQEVRNKGRILTAKAALEKGLAVELIAEITGIPLEEIRKLQSQ